MTADPWLEAQAHLRRIPVIGPLVERYGSCTLLPKTDYFAVLCDSIISQQISVKASEAIFRRFSDFFQGNPLPGIVAQATAEELKQVGISGQKASYLLDLARKFAGREVAYTEFDKMDNEEIIRELTKVKGIGRWTAEMFLIFALNRPDVLPVADLGIRRAVQVQYGLQELATAADIEQAAGEWHPYETAACWYLWRSLENKQ